MTPERCLRICAAAALAQRKAPRRFLIRDVGLDEYRVAAHPRDAAERRARLRRAQVADRHLGTFLRQELGGRPADAACATRDDHYLALQTHRVLPPWSVRRTALRASSDRTMAPCRRGSASVSSVAASSRTSTARRGGQAPTRSSWPCATRTRRAPASAPPSGASKGSTRTRPR